MQKRSNSKNYDAMIASADGYRAKTLTNEFKELLKIDYKNCIIDKKPFPIWIWSFQGCVIHILEDSYIIFGYKTSN